MKIVPLLDKLQTSDSFKDWYFGLSEFEQRSSILATIGVNNFRILLKQKNDNIYGDVLFVEKIVPTNKTLETYINNLLKLEKL